MRVDQNSGTWDASGPVQSRLKAFSSLASQGAAIIRSKSMAADELGASFGELSGFWRCWSDGAIPPGEDAAGLGGVVVDDQGVASAAFSVVAELDGCRKGPMLAELRALERAMALAWDAGARRLEARFDCLPLARAAAAALLGDPSELSNTEGAELLVAMERFDCVALRWAPREANRLADALSKRPFGGGLFNGGPSQKPWLAAAWEDPQGGLSALSGMAQGLAKGDFAAEPSASRRQRAAISHEELSAGGGSIIVAGACWREGACGGTWIGAASAADPQAQRSAKIEQCGAWGLGSAREEGSEGLRAAMSQALAKKMASIAAKASGSVSSFEILIPSTLMEALAEGDSLRSFASGMLSLAQAIAPNAAILINEAEAGSRVSPRQAAHLLNGWELGRALEIQEIYSARENKRKIRSIKPKA